jgi:tetratricopeptide (TPR) repeat protein
MRLSNLFIAAGTATLLTACAGSAPAPSPSQSTPSNLLASWSGGKIEASGWENWKTNSGMGPETPAADAARMFNDYVRVQLDAQAAKDAGIHKIKAKADRWESITERILADKVRRDYLMVQQGFSDSAIDKWAAGQDSTIRKLPKDSLRVRGGRALALASYKLDSVYEANKESFKIDSLRYKPLDSAKAEVEDLALRSHTEKIMASFAPDLRTRYAVKLTPATRPDPIEDTLKAFWNDNKDRWVNPAIFQLVALGSKDSAKLAKAVVKVNDLAAFKKLASKFPIGTPAAPEGVLGRVKNQYALPYGIGMAPELFSLLDTSKTGMVLPVVRANDSLFMVAWMSGRDSAKVKPYESVRAEVRSEWLRLSRWTPPADAPLASWDKGVLFTQGEVDFIAEEVPSQMRRQYPTERILDFMITWKVSARFAKENGFDKRPETQSTLADNQKLYLAQEWRQTPQATMFLFDKKTADSATTYWYDSLYKNTSMAIDSSAGANRDGARLSLLPKGGLHHNYLINIDKHLQDSVYLPYDSVRARIFEDMRFQLDEQGRERIDSVLKARYDFKFHPAAPVVAPLPFAAAFDSARVAHDRRVLDQAEALYRQVEKDPSAPDSIRAQALFQMGQLFGEQQNYPRSLSAYRSVLVRFPKSNEAYKAQFMIGFTYSEYLKNENAALVEYGKMLTNYPKSDLTDDADWMIRNIKSGGALMPKFDDSAFVADSTARADSLKKASGAETSAAPSIKPTAKVETAQTAPATPAQGGTPAATKPAAAPKATAKGDSAKAGSKK